MGFTVGFWLAVIAVFAGIIFVSFIMLLSNRYKRCPSNCVLVIFGKAGQATPAKCIHGGAAFIWPLIQDYAFMSLEPIQIDTPLKDALSAENIRVSVPSEFTVAIGTEPETMQNASIRLLGLDPQHISKQAQNIIYGQLRQVIASMHIDEINRDREKFLHNIQHSLEPELRKIGLVLINVNIIDITDESGYIEAIGKKAASQAIQQARGDVAEQVKMGETRVAEAERDKFVQVADANKLREIGIHNAQMEQAVRVAELERDQKVGEQRASFEKDAQVKEAERDMRVSVANANATAIEGENLAQAKVASSNADLLVKRADAYQLGETRKRTAEAAVLEAQNHAMAKAAVADAERVEMERRAAVEAPAKAEKARVIVEAEAEAQKRRIEAEGEASAIFVKLDAQARGQYEILAKKGEGLRRIVDACGGSEDAYRMLMIEHLDAIADASAKAISNIKFDKIVVWEGGGKDGASNTAGFLHNLAKSMPPVLQVMKDIGGVEFPEYLVKLSPDAAAKPPADAKSPEKKQ
jgi:flotillin